MGSAAVWAAIAVVSSGYCCSFAAVAAMGSAADSDVAAAAKIATSYEPKRSCQQAAPFSVRQNNSKGLPFRQPF